MKHCVIFCAGEFTTLLRPIPEAATVIAADGGLAHLIRLGIAPDIILGDFDSLGYIPRNAEVHPVEKDDTDTMLAIKKALSRGCQEFWIYGGMDGPRPDHTVANYQALQYIADHGGRGYLVGNNAIATVVKNGTVSFPADAKGMLSVFCMGADAHGVSLKGLKYTLEDGTLRAGVPLGTSNQFIGENASVTVTQGSLLLIWERTDI